MARYFPYNFEDNDSRSWERDSSWVTFAGDMETPMALVSARGGSKLVADPLPFIYLDALMTEAMTGDVLSPMDTVLGRGGAKADIETPMVIPGETVSMYPGRLFAADIVAPFVKLTARGGAKLVLGKTPMVKLTAAIIVGQVFSLSARMPMVRMRTDGLPTPDIYTGNLYVTDSNLYMPYPRLTAEVRVGTVFQGDTTSPLLVVQGVMKVGHNFYASIETPFPLLSATASEDFLANLDQALPFIKLTARMESPERLDDDVFQHER